jgi:hypothetical protein
MAAVIAALSLPSATIVSIDYSGHILGQRAGGHTCGTIQL